MPRSDLTTTLGTLPAAMLPSEEFLKLQFLPTRQLRNQRWQNFGLSADFLGDYFAAFFPGDIAPNHKINRRDIVKGSISYIANELIENGVKYNDSRVKLPITITLQLYEHHILVEVINHAASEQADRYQAFIQTLLESDLDEFYTQQLEKSALGDGHSNMGILMLMNDYGAELGWVFKPIAHQDQNDAIFQVKVVAKLAL